jgi:DNA-binding CsgD family transcriptional regulator
MDKWFGGASALVGRREELAAVRAALTEGGCLIAGSAGVGKSRLAAEAVGDEGVVRVIATAAAGSMPFGAFGHLLPADAGSGPPSVSDLIAAVRGLCADREGDRPALLVDDVHLLDDASAALVLAVALSGAATVLLTVRSGEPSPDAITSVWKERVIDRVDLQPLSRSEVRLLVDELLGGRVHTLVYDWIYDLSRGSPLYVAELIAGSRRTGRLLERDGRWQLTGAPAEFGRLGELIEANVRRVSPAARRALEVLAIGAPLTLAQVERLASPEAIEELEDGGLARTTTGMGARVGMELAHPLYGEVILDALPGSAARRLRRTVAEVLAPDCGDNQFEQLRVATLLLHAGTADPDRFLAASPLALRHGAPELANRLAEAAGGGLDGALSLARARSAIGRFDDVEPILARYERRVSRASAAVAAGYVQTRFRALLRGTGGGEAAHAVLDRMADWHDDLDWRALIAAQRASAELYQGAPASAREHLLPFMDADGLGPDRRYDLLIMAILATSRLGLVEDRAALDRRLEQLVATYADAPWEAAIGVVRVDVLSHLNAGPDLHAVGARAQRALGDARASDDRQLQGMLAYILGELMLVRGHAAQALGHFQTAQDSLTLGDPLNAAGEVLLSIATARALLGELEEACRALDEAEAFIARRPGMGQRLAPAAARARAMIDAAAGRESAARDQLIRLARSAGEDVVTEVEALYGALGLGADPNACADRLAILASGAQGEIVGLFAAHARALAGGDVAAQLVLAQRFEAAGLDLTAAEAAVRAAAAASQDGLNDLSRRAASLAVRCATRCPGVLTPALRVPIDTPALTAREREIGVLAARGLSNAEIAGTLVLSVRSVETYVLRVCRKLGVNSRTHLIEELCGSAWRPLDRRAVARATR